MSENDLLLRLFDQLAAQAAGDADALCAAHDLPPEAAPLASAALAVALAGARRGLVGWRPLPPLEDGEAGALGEAVAALVSDRVAEALEPLRTQRDRAAQRSRSDLLAWNRERRAAQLADQPSAAALAAMKDPHYEPVMEREELPDGRFRLRYRLREQP